MLIADYPKLLLQLTKNGFNIAGYLMVLTCTGSADLLIIHPHPKEVSLKPFFVNGAIYSIKCVSGRVSFYEDDVLKEELDSDYDFDPTVITSAYVAAGQSQNNTTFVVQSDIGSSPSPGSGGTRLPPPPIVLGGL